MNGKLRILSASGAPPEAIKMAPDVGELYGLAFKPDIGDLRESSTLEIAHDLVASYPGPVRVIEPNIGALSAGMVHAAVNSDIYILLVDRREFWSRTKPAKTTFDMRGIWANQKGAA